MTRKIALLLLIAVLPFTGCDKVRDKIPFLKKKVKPDAAAATPAPATAPAPIAAAPLRRLRTTPALPASPPAPADLP